MEEIVTLLIPILMAVTLVRLLVLPLRLIWKLYAAEQQGVVADLRNCVLPE